MDHRIPYSERKQCPFCGQLAGKPCRTQSGTIARNSHRERLHAVDAGMRSEHYVVRILEDQPELDLSASEEYLAITYWLDPGKATLLARLPDGKDPQVNQYRRTIQWLRWATDADRAARVMDSALS